ncbi:MAG: cyclic nucleotide-binding domain-containing protein [Candidatus Dormibacteria bacterium]
MKDGKVELIRRVPLFSRCGKRELDFLASQMDEVQVPPGEPIIRQGHPSHGFYIVVTGSLRVDIDGREVATMGPGDFVGEISMLDRGPATATVTPTEPADLFALSHDQFRNAIRSEQGIALQVMEAMAERLRSNEDAGLRRAGWSGA